MKKNILITSIAAKVPLINCVLESKNKFDKSIRVYGADIDKSCIGQYFVDSFYIMPKINILKINDFIDGCNEKNIKYIIPSRDADVLYFSAYKDKLEENSIYLFSPDVDVVNICFDKLKFYESVKDKLIIPTYKNISDVNSSSFVVKQRFGSGSDNIAINVDKTTALNFAMKLKDPVYQPFIEGKEYSIDSYVDKNANRIASVIRSRDLVKNGESQITTYIKDEVLDSIVKQFVENLNISGHSVTQVIGHDNSYSIIECNTRFGGASTLSYKMGLESFYWFLMEVNDKSIVFKLNNKKLKQVRVAEDKYFEC